jgi:phage terminase large subunit
MEYRTRFYEMALKYPKLKLLLVYNRLPDIIPFQWELADIAKWNRLRRYFLFPNESRLRIGDSRTDNYVRQYYAGQEFDVIGFVGSDISEYAVRFISCCLRSARLDFKPQIYFI